jgi:hypothetical protein
VSVVSSVDVESSNELTVKPLLEFGYTVPTPRNQDELVQLALIVSFARARTLLAYARIIDSGKSVLDSAH